MVCSKHTFIWRNFLC